ncbi:MAG: hypothetical protein M1133_08980 [Armatimonadetes bacterium]|nr:hypothetical protein [Armatimonadota bacterium]
MGDIGHGYGSEWHLMRYLGRHRNRLNEKVCQVTGAQLVDWLDFPFGDQRPYLAEHKGLEFLFGETADSLKEKWAQFWPQSGNSQNWDAVGWLRNGTQYELLLVEAKCHETELTSDCGAKERGGRSLIVKSLDEAKSAFGATKGAPWTGPYYQYCNRLAVLHFLRKNQIPARLLFIYFTGDIMGSRNCPVSEAGWEKILQVMYDHIGISWDVQEAHGVHKVFLPVSGNP